MDVVLVPVPTTVVLTTMSNPTLMTTVYSRQSQP